LKKKKKKKKMTAGANNSDVDVEVLELNGGCSNADSALYIFSR